MSDEILVIGNTNMELFMSVERFPDAGDTVIDGGGAVYMPGGRATSSAVAFRRLGANTALLSKLGRDLNGQRLYQYFKDAGISTAHLKVDADNQTGLTVNVREADGTERAVVYRGANDRLTEDNISDALASCPRAVYMTLELPYQLISAALRRAESMGIPSVIDAVGSGRDYPLENLPYCEIFSPNSEQTELFTGVKPLGADSSLRAALLLYKRIKCKYIVIKQGERGAFIYDGKHYFMIPPIRAGKTVDESGAGDAFGAAMTIGYVSGGCDIKNAVRYGVAVGALTVTRAGGAATCPTLTEVEEFLSNNTV